MVSNLVLSDFEHSCTMSELNCPGDTSYLSGQFTLVLLIGKTHRRFRKVMQIVEQYRTHTLSAVLLRYLTLSLLAWGVILSNLTLLITAKVHGVVFDTIDFVWGIISNEINSSTDNPLVHNFA